MDSDARWGAAAAARAGLVTAASWWVTVPGLDGLVRAGNAVKITMQCYTALLTPVLCDLLLLACHRRLLHSNPRRLPLADRMPDPRSKTDHRQGSTGIRPVQFVAVPASSKPLW